MENVLEMRGHHLICILGFQNKGYSEDFISKMKIIRDNFFGNRNCLVSITNNFDILCNICPHKKTVCSFPEKYFISNKRIREMDDYVIRILMLSLGEYYSSLEIQSRIIQYFEVSHLDILCKDCVWRSLGLCEEGLKYLKKHNSIKPLLTSSYSNHI